ncbi:helix-turn-helix transcriptional regulator [Paenibacillus glucanolyticus]|uniref:helix-turn-helix domain-containing protein n=1 Tax=Paenibacillus glucanolyticus TaxID=59843 RepID=UPI0030CB70DB
MNQEVIIFGQVIQRLRKVKNMTQEKLSETANLERTFISYLENGHKVPSLITVFQLANGLGIEASSLIKMVEDEIKRSRKR